MEQWNTRNGMLRAVIIDDEPHNSDTLGKLIKRHCPGIIIAGKADGIKTGIEVIRELNPDLVFLDFNMNDGTGFDLLRAFSPVGFRVIFVSAMDKETERAFLLSGMEYLLKPVSSEKLKLAVEKVLKMELQHFALQLQVLEEDLT